MQIHKTTLTMEGDGPSLMGRDWLQHFKLDWTQLHQVQANPQDDLERMLDKHKIIFKDELGKVKGVTAKLHLKPNAKPRFH